MESTKVPIPADALEGLEAVRLTGKTNMLDAPRVIELAFEMGHAATAFWVYENRRQYAEGIFQGFAAVEFEAGALASPDERRRLRHVAQHVASDGKVDKPSEARTPRYVRRR